MRRTIFDLKKQKREAYRRWISVCLLFAVCFLIAANAGSPLNSLVRFYSGEWWSTEGVVTGTAIHPIQARTSRSAWNGYAVNYRVSYQVDNEKFVGDIYYAPGSEKKIWDVDVSAAHKLAEENMPATVATVFYAPSNPTIAYVEKSPLLDQLGPWIILGSFSALCIVIALGILIRYYMVLK